MTLFNDIGEITVPEQRGWKQGIEDDQRSPCSEVFPVVKDGKIARELDLAIVSVSYSDIVTQ